MASDGILDHASEMLFTVLHDIVKHVKLQRSKNNRLYKIYPAFQKLAVSYICTSSCTAIRNSHNIAMHGDNILTFARIEHASSHSVMAM